MLGEFYSIKNLISGKSSWKKQHRFSSCLFLMNTIKWQWRGRNNLSTNIDNSAFKLIPLERGTVEVPVKWSKIGHTVEEDVRQIHFTTTKIVSCGFSAKIFLTLWFSKKPKFQAEKKSLKFYRNLSEFPWVLLPFFARNLHYLSRLLSTDNFMIAFG